MNALHMLYVQREMLSNCKPINIIESLTAKTLADIKEHK